MCVSAVHYSCIHLKHVLSIVIQIVKIKPKKKISCWILSHLLKTAVKIRLSNPSRPYLTTGYPPLNYVWTSRLGAIFVGTKFELWIVQRLSQPGPLYLKNKALELFIKPKSLYLAAFDIKMFKRLFKKEAEPPKPDEVRLKMLLFMMHIELHGFIYASFSLNLLTYSFCSRLLRCLMKHRLVHSFFFS